MDISRIALKLELADPGAVAPEELIGVFHGWIRREAVPGLLIDVTSYAHVRNGPGVLLIGHEADHSLDLGDGRPGLLYTRKRGPAGPVGDLLRESAGALALAARALLEEPTLGGRAALRTDALGVRVLDRLNAPNTAETLEALREDLEALGDALWPGAAVALGRSGLDPRAPFTVELAADRPAALDDWAALRGGQPVPA